MTGDSGAFPEWLCPGCGAAVPETFDVCWQCGEAPPPDAPRRVLPTDEEEGTAAPRQEALPRGDPPAPAVAVEVRGRTWLELLAVTLLVLWPRMYPGLCGWFGPAPESVDVASNAWSGPLWWAGALDQDLVWIGQVLLMGLLLRREPGVRFDPRRLRWPRELGLVVVTIAGIWLLEGLLFVGAYGWGLVDATGPAADESDTWHLGAWLHLPLWSLIAAAMEEMLFRVYLWHRLAALTSRPTAAMFFCAALFAVAHGDDAAGTLMHFVFGVCLGAIYCRWRNVPRIVLVHWGYNMWLDFGPGLA